MMTWASRRSAPHPVVAPPAIGRIGVRRITLQGPSGTGFAKGAHTISTFLKVTFIEARGEAGKALRYIRG